jgi:hypothetical protein
LEKLLTGISQHDLILHEIAHFKEERKRKKRIKIEKIIEIILTAAIRHLAPTQTW